MMNSVVTQVTDRIVARSESRRARYLAQLDAARQDGPARAHAACSNLAHAFAGADSNDQGQLKQLQWPTIGIVTAYNDLLSAHRPYETYPERIKAAARRVRAVAQVAGGVPAMCDGVTQGRPGMELSLFSREVIAMSTAVALAHDTFDSAMLLGVCDKIVPGLVIGALSYGHLPVVMVPAGPMPSGLPNKEKARIREEFAKGNVSRDALLEAECAAYHAPGTCTFYGTANTNQFLMEMMGLHLPGAAFVNPGSALRDTLTEQATERAAAITQLGNDYTPIGRLIDERCIVNAIVGLHATGGSTNHTIHLVAMARAAGVIINWDDFAELSSVVPLLARVYPNGDADINHFHAAGGTGFVIGQLRDAGLVHDDVQTIAGPGLSHYCQEPFIDPTSAMSPARATWRAAPTVSLDLEVLRGVDAPFQSDGGLRVLEGNLGRAVMKVSAVAPEHRSVTAPARVFASQDAVVAAFDAGELTGDVVVVLTRQGPRSNGMPELHRLTPLLGVLQARGQRVALVTDGRMSGASGKVPAAIHVTPETVVGGALGRVRDGDVITLDADEGRLSVTSRPQDYVCPHRSHRVRADQGAGRELFAIMRSNVSSAEEGAVTF